MDVVTHDKLQELFEYLPRIKASVKEWVLIDVRIKEEFIDAIPVNEVVSRIQNEFHDKEGKVYVGRNGETLVVLRCGEQHTEEEIIQTVGKCLPAGSCEIHAHKTTLENLKERETLIAFCISGRTQPLMSKRFLRATHAFLVADDDMYQRMLIKQGLQKLGSIHEATTGDEVVKAYREYNPDILFLDIHMPGQSGLELVPQILAVDSHAWIVMVSADSSADNVSALKKGGAKDFLAKPFTKERLLQCVRKCPTLTHVTAAQHT